MSLWSEKIRYRVSALVLLAIIAGIAILTVAMYQNAFVSTAQVTIKADRAGLQMRKGTVVKLRGVDVGKIDSAHPNADGTVDVIVAMKPDKLDQVPSNVGVSLEQLTAFGNKHVALTMPQKPSSQHLAEGSVLNADHVSVEVNTVFERLDKVLDRLEPAKVSAMLGAIAETVRGRGADIGETIDVTEAYLRKINRDLPQLARDFDKGAQVLDVYAAATPDLMKLLDNGAHIAETIVAERANLRRLLHGLGEMSVTGERFLAENGDKLVDVLASAVSTTELLKKYAPGLTCFLQGMDKGNRLLEKNFGGKVPGVTAIVFLLQGNEPYRNPENLPVMGADNGPNCHGLPGYDGSYIPDSLMVPFDKGGEPNPPGPDEDKVRFSEEPLVVQLFGPLASMEGVPAKPDSASTRGGTR